MLPPLSAHTPRPPLVRKPACAGLQRSATSAGSRAVRRSAPRRAAASRQPSSSIAARRNYGRRRVQTRWRGRRAGPRRAAVPPRFGLLVQTLDGTVVREEHADTSFNPASAIKLLTAFAALKRFGADHRFVTSLVLDGKADGDSGLFKGDVFVQGEDPDFDRSDALVLLQALRERGITRIEGRLVVSPAFSFRHNGDPVASARSMVSVWRSSGVANSVSLAGPIALGRSAAAAVAVFQHESEPLKSTLKVMLSRSLNGCAERIGCVAGGVPALERLAVDDIGCSGGSIQLASCSGLGVNRMTPKQMMQVLRALHGELREQGLSFQDILPVAGIDDGTLVHRFESEEERGSVVAKTGTLTTTDGGASALVGVLRSQQEDLYFVLFGQRGNVSTLRSRQDATIRALQQERGGPRSFDYPYCRVEADEDTTGIDDSCMNDSLLLISAPGGRTDATGRETAAGEAL